MRPTAVALLTLLACDTPAPPRPPVAEVTQPTLPTCPTLAKGTVTSPSVQMADGSAFGGGKGALVDAEGRRVYLTVHHLFGPESGLPRQLAGEELPTAVEGLVLHDPDTGAELFRLGPPVAVPGAAPASEAVDKDLAVIDAPELAPADPAGAPTPGLLPLARTAPAVGEFVCLYTSTVDFNERGLLARVTTSIPARLGYELLGATRMLGTDGAPVINLAGELVGVQVNGKAGPPSVGTAAPVGAVRRALRAAGYAVSPAGG